LAQPSRKLVVSAETGGLGNRIKSWVSAMRLDSEARVHWPITPNMAASFGDLFVGDHAVSAIPAEATIYYSWRLLILPEDERHLPRGFATAGAGSHPLVRAFGKAWWMLRGRPSDRYRYMLFPKTYSRDSVRADARHIDLEYERIPVALRQVYAPLFARIAIQPRIAMRVEQWAAANLGADVIGVQVRTWRDDPRRERKYHRPARRRLARLLAAEPKARFLVVADSDDAVATLVEHYGAGRILHFPRATPRRESYRSVEGIAEDLIDMLLLARTRRLFASYLSTFSEVAWWLGGAKAAVTVF
jgi:hypothetical protein